MSDIRFLSLEEADLIQQAAERWLRLRDVEFNPGEYASRLVADSILHTEPCLRRDVASLGRAILLEVAGQLEPVCMTIVRPQEENLRRARVSILSDLGLACIGRRICSEFCTPYGTTTFIGFADTLPVFERGLFEEAARESA